jgi:hypothetical protein
MIIRALVFSKLLVLYVATPLLEECEDDTHTPKMGTCSRIAGVKTPRIGVFFISLKSYESVDVENELAWAIWTSATQVMCK